VAWRLDSLSLGHTERCRGGLAGCLRIPSRQSAAFLRFASLTCARLCLSGGLWFSSDQVDCSYPAFSSAQ
jgi:hypothetical protein